MIRELRKGAKRLQCYSDFIRDFSLKKFIEVHISTDRRYFYCIFTMHMTSICEKKSLAEVRLTHAEQTSYS